MGQTKVVLSDSVFWGSFVMYTGKQKTMKTDYGLQHSKLVWTQSALDELLEALWLTS